MIHEYLHLLSDPAHLAVELTLMLLVDGLVLGLVLPFVKRRLARELITEHRIIDAEHGIPVHPIRERI